MRLHRPSAIPSPGPLSRVRSAVASLLLIGGLLLASPARAEERKHAWELGGYVGYNYLGNELQLDDTMNYGLRAGWYFTPAYQVEIQWTRSASTSMTDVGSTLVLDESIFLTNTSREWSFDSYTGRFIINPRNEHRRLKPYAQMGLGTIKWSASPELESGEEGDIEGWIASVGVGLRYRLGAYTQFRAEFEDQYAIAEVYSNFNINVGLTWVFGGGRPPDTDDDGILDLKDRCPDTPKGALVDKHDGCPWDIDRDGVMEGLDECAATPEGWAVDEKGCALESDGDAVPDGLDKCADTPKGAIVNADGCPADSDKDGIFDGLDRCPGTPVGAVVDAVDAPTAGCPKDTDNDGSPDGVDQCALTPQGATIDEKGCPQDADGDRVLDGIDVCPDTPKGQRIDKEGCPRVRLDKNEPQILQNVKFHGMELYPGSEGWLSLLVDAAIYWQEVVFEVGVYTDNEGGVAANRAAAQRRTEVLKAWLVQQGIPASRFVAKAYGPVNFITDNSTEEGRDKNRRVEVKRLSGDIRRHPKPTPEAEAPPAGTEPVPPAAPEKPPAEAPAVPPATPPAEPPAEPPAPPEPGPAEPQPSEPPATPPAPEEPKPEGETKPEAEPQPEPPPAPEGGGASAGH